MELIDKDGNKEYRVSDNVSMSYCILSPEIDLAIHWQGPMVERIWRDASIFYHRLDARECAKLLEESGYYEYGMSSFYLNADWDDVVKARYENECYHCHGSRWVDVIGRTISEKCETCDGTGLKKPMDGI